MEDNSHLEDDPSGNNKSVMDTTLDKLRQIKGKVFHMIDGNNQLVRFTFGKDGQLFLENVPRIHLSAIPTKMLEAGKEIKDKMREVRKDTQGRAQKKWRKAVTGDAEKSVREHMKEIPQVKMIDKISFTFGVLCICGSEWLALRKPDWFPLYYYAFMSVLLVWRFITYSRDKYQLFMLDFCYFVNLSVALQTAFFPTNINWFKANYILCMGPLMFAIVVWKNSLVFHSLDKLTSFFLHAFPPLTVHLLRWGLIHNPSVHADDFIAPLEVIILPLGLYLCWQLGYWTITEGALRSQLANDPEMITSLRYLARDKKNGFRNLCLSLLCWLGFSQPGEELDPDSFKAKVTFAVTQLIYTLITIIPTPFLYNSYSLSCIYLMLLYGFGTWNGASYYIEVFAERYHLQFSKTSGNAKKDVTDRNDTDSIGDIDEFDNALENADIDQSSELYKTIVAAIIENQQTTGNKDVMDWTMNDLDNSDTDISNAEAPELVNDKLLTDQNEAEEDMLVESSSSSESNGQAWEDLVLGK